ncbi:hypothetical protein E1B28_000543 [Marasmius oreades]|uniref:Xylanolytic transcriptional activator regulatory domain-containing protein n=1 Tax=Marasmius oreades TaxID=181124 RepID=A0A9P8AE90_9AGAR|nr:uncharacterized protein E1B28_000543 [Marasmius oreades]KAG7098621.1 hypothetical protein E1B28_000543 [Marasmius oreades]
MPDSVCTKCAQSRKLCTYLEASKPRGPPKAYITSLEDKMEIMEGVLKRLRPDQDFSEELGPPILRDSWRLEDPANVESHSSHAYLPISFPSTSHSGVRAFIDPNDSESETDSVSNNPYSSDSDGLVDKFTTGMARLTLRGADAPAEQEENHVRFHGKSSSMNLIDVTRKFKQMHIQQTLDRDGATSLNSQRLSNPSSFNANFTRRPEYWRLPKWEFAWEGLHIRSPEFLTDVLAKFPPPELTTTLFDLYFHHINILFPLIHKPTFERQWKGRLHERNIWFACLTMSIFALGSRWCQDVRVLPESEQVKPAETIDWTLAGWDYFSVCVSVHRMRRSLFFPASLFEIQTFSTMSLFLRGTSTQTTAWLFITMGMRKAQDAGAHRKTIYHRTPTVDDELWKRAFWMLVGLDRVTSAALGRPCSIDDENFDLDPPLDVDDEYWENDDPALAFQQPTGKPSRLTSFILWLSLTDVIAFAIRTLYCVRPNGGLMEHMKPPAPEDLVKRLDRSLVAWMDKIPEYLRWGRDMQDHVTSNQSTMLYNTYYFTQILVHRPFIRPLRITSLDGNVASPCSALALCSSAAKTCVRIIERQTQFGYSNVIELVHIAQVAAAILIIEVWHLKAKERVHKATNKEEDTKPKYVQSIQELLEEVEILMKALQWAKPRYGHVPLILAKLQEALPNNVENATMEIPMYTLHELTAAPSEAPTASGLDFDAAPIASHPPSHWPSAGTTTNTKPSPTTSYPLPYIPQTAFPQPKSYSSFASGLDDHHTNSNGVEELDTRPDRLSHSALFWQPTPQAPDISQYSISDRIPSISYNNSPRRQSYVVPPLAAYYGGVDEYGHHNGSTGGTSSNAMIDSRGAYHPVSNARSIPAPSYHPFAIKDPAYKPHLGYEPWNYQSNGPPSYSSHAESRDTQGPHSQPRLGFPHTAYFSYPYAP